MPLSKVVVVGAGPSGLLLTLLLARNNIPVLLVEQTNTLDTNSRATHHGEPATYEFERAGVLDAIRGESFFPVSLSWRKLDEQKSRPKPAEIRYSHKVISLDEDAESGQAWVDVESPSGPQRLSADYIIGCDGANSKVRRLLFSDKTFPGHTWDEQIVATNMYYDFSPYDYDDTQFFIHPKHWHMVAKIQKDGLYRVTDGEVGGLSREELEKRLPGKYKAFLPGAPDAGEYKVVNFNPYRVHQRCVDRMRKGRFVLAADAAHLCNPFGGMGLTGGIADIGSLYDSLLGIHTGHADDSILDKYDEIRRKIWHEIINPTSSSNMRRLIDLDADTALDEDAFLQLVKRTETDEALQAQMRTGMMALRHDMTHYYHQA